MRGLKTVIGLVIVVAVVAIGWYVFIQRVKAAVPNYQTAQVTRGSLVATISATGTIEPEDVVDVGAQVAGQILSFGQDDSGKPVDYNSVVRQGMVLARIDPSLYEADLQQAQAQLQQAQAAVVAARANLLQNQAQLEQAQEDWNRAQKLGPSQALAQMSYDAYRAAYDVAKANVAAAQASIAEANANVSQARASVTRAQRNLSYCVIRSPVDGVIIDRRVNIGQTVVSSLSAPSLFLIAKDLHRMEVWVAVNEADVGNIHAGQPVTFTVDAFPGEHFRGTVSKVRLDATMTQNVVTYTVQVATNNASGRLLPYLTANVAFELAQRKDVLKVPNSALQWTPDLKEVAPQYRKGLPAEESQAAASMPATMPANATKAMGYGIVWVKDGQYLKPVAVRTGISDGADTEIADHDVSAGMSVITGERVSSSADQAVTNPFTPQFGRVFQRNRQQNQQQGSAQKPGQGGGGQPHTGK